MTKPAKFRRKPLGASAECCPTCGRPMPPALQMPRIRQRIFDLLARHGEIHKEVLHTAIWGSDPNGGPEMSVLRAHVWHLNRELRPYGQAVRNVRRSGVYRLVRIAEAAE